MREANIVRWMLGIIALTSAITLSLTTYGLHQNVSAFRVVVETNTNDAIRRESKLSHNLTQMIEMRSEGVSNAFLAFEQDNMLQMRKMAEIEVARQLHGQTKEIFK